MRKSRLNLERDKIGGAVQRYGKQSRNRNRNRWGDTFLIYFQKEEMRISTKLPAKIRPDAEF
jgi:hypothetical protein